MHLVFFHGSNNADRSDIGDDQWGFDGPVVTEIGLQSTYGNVRILDGNGDECDLEFEDGCVMVAGKYYGDWYLIDNDNEEELCSLKEEGRQFLTFDEFKDLTNHKVEGPHFSTTLNTDTKTKTKYIRDVFKKKIK